MHFKVYSEKCTSYFEHFRASAASKPLPAEGPVILNVALLYITVQLLKIFLTALQEELPLKGLNNKLNRTQDFFLSLFGLHNYVFQNCPLQQYERYMSHVNQVEFFADPITH